MKIFQPVFVATVLITLSACSTRMPSQPSGFLSSYNKLSPSTDGSMQVLPAQVPIDTNNVKFNSIEWRVSKDKNITAEEQVILSKQLQDALHSEIKSAPAKSGARKIVLKAAITDVATVSAGLNTVSTVLLFAPVDRGGAAVEIEAIDAENGKQLAALTIGYFAPMTEVKARFSRLAPAEIALHKAASEFAAQLK